MSLINCGDITLSSIRNSAERCLKLSSSPLQGTLRSGKRRGKKTPFMKPNRVGKSNAWISKCAQRTHSFRRAQFAVCPKRLKGSRVKGTR